jgi:hypothetical protein
MAFYLVVRAGFFPTGSSAGPDNTTLANGPYYFAGLAALVGMFSKQTTDKLREIFEVLFSQKNPVNRADPLTSIALAISGTTPPKLTVKTPVTLIVNGHGFLASSKVTINGTVRTFEFVSEAQIKIAITADDVAKPGKLELAIQNPATPAAAAKITIEIEEKQQAPAPAAPKLQISGTDPQHLTKGTATPLTINGQGFEKNCTVTVNGEARTPTSVEDKKIVVEIQAKDVAAEGDAKIVITNPAPNGATGEIVVKVQ